MTMKATTKTDQYRDLFLTNPKGDSFDLSFLKQTAQQHASAVHNGGTVSQAGRTTFCDGLRAPRLLLDSDI